MFRWKKLARPFGYFALLGALLATHAFAFQAGSKKQFQHTKNEIQKSLYASHENALQASNTLLQVAVKNPQSIQPDDLRSMKNQASNHADFVEKFYLPQATQTGNHTLQQQLATEVATTRDLQAKLPTP